MPVVKAVHRPIIVRDDVALTDAETPAHIGHKLRRPVERPPLLADIAKLANLDADALRVAGAVVVGVLARFIKRHVLDDFAVVHREVPDVEPAFVPLGLRPNFPLAQQPCVRRRGATGAPGAVDGDEGRAKWDVYLTPEFPIRDEVFANGQTAGDGRA